MSDEIDKYEALSDHDLQAAARKKGLYVATDKFGHWYLQLLERPSHDKTINPHLVMISLLREEILRYVLEHQGEHRVMTPREYFKALGRPDPDEAADDETEDG